MLLQRRPWNHNERRSEERMPEWMDGGPDTILDTIELKGFDDDPNNPNNSLRQNGKGKGARVLLSQSGWERLMLHSRKK